MGSSPTSVATLEEAPRFFSGLFLLISELAGMKASALFVNSSLAFASAQLLTAVFHEAGHGFAAQALGFSPRIYAFYENNPTGSPAQNAIVLAAGPLASLLLGVAFLLWYRRQPARDGFGRLLIFWIAWLGILEFVNYVMVTPFLSAGDTAQLADILHWPLWPRYAVAIAAALAVWFLARLAAACMFAAAPADVALESPSDRRRFILRGFYLPLIAGVFLTAFAGIGSNPINVALGLLGAFGNIDLVAASLYRGRVRDVVTRAAGKAAGISGVGFWLYAAIVLFYVAVLSRGLPV